ncbi:ARABIDOPSIS ARIADNE 8, ARIADNE 8 [Hibiscus trionum]|uniref:RBR-type E3 ubiquitin transferase n=1 Tax=Hibiscus trionum TaxID=183268 RepID=A0A9W7HSC2_HIBTR|nr:ARABIDOPSIS ARIADNE 8, ARIADNE 8 [Hibiscus trionum]
MVDSVVDDAYDDDSYNDDTDDDVHPLQGNDSHDDDHDHDDVDDANAIEEDGTDDLPMFRQNCTVLTEADIRQRVTDTIAEVSSVLSLSKIEAGILLLHYNWSVSNVFDAWFADEKLAREKAGLFVKPLVELPDHGGSILCEICFEYYPSDGLKSTRCGHPYCNDCWSSYIKTSIAGGPESLLLKCPHLSCRAAVGEDMVGLFASELENKKYSGYFVMSYIESNRMIKWCPGPGCGNAVDFVAGSESFDVSCLCSHSFCWNCTQEAHRPVDCETMTKWMLKNSSESENVNYILAFTKPCPKCKRPIEKNMGCSHMSCRAPCYFEFCWLCLKDWTNHGVCNRFRGRPEEERREKAKKYMMKYAHYFERWATNKKSMKKAADDLQNVQSEQIEIVRRIQEKSAAEISFITEAWQQIIECRRVLAWTYAYGFYLPDECEAKRNLFEYLQGQAESGLERLHDCAEKELLPFFKRKGSTMEFIDFRKKLILLTGVTRNYFDNLVTALQNGLSDVNSEGSSSVLKKFKKRKLIGTAAAVTGAPDFNTNINDNSATGIAMEPWACAYCSFENEVSSAFCTMCGRGSWTCDVCTFANSRTSTTCAMCAEALEP